MLILTSDNYNVYGKGSLDPIEPSQHRKKRNTFKQRSENLERSFALQASVTRAEPKSASTQEAERKTNSPKNWLSDRVQL
ncbi:hypothetical protein BC834DRAFT_887735, partial [Gloeopeniophorella convolvens]